MKSRSGPNAVFRTLTLVGVLCSGFALTAQAADAGSAPMKSGSVPAVASATDIKFRDFFRMPVGPKGLELTERVRALSGKRVSIVGYMAKADVPTPGLFILSPLPVELGDEDEALADDLPAASLFVHLAPGDVQSVAFQPGLLHLTGTLSVGAQEEADSRVSTFRLMLDRPLQQSLVVLPIRQASK